MLFAKILGTVVKEIAKRNTTREDVKTADPRVFEDLQKEMECYEEPCEDDFAGPTRNDMYKGMADRVKKAQQDNEANPDIETADKSIYEELLSEIETLKQQVQTRDERKIDLPEPLLTSSGTIGMRATTNSGGSIQMREQPDMGSAKQEIRVPDQSEVKILSYSDNSINLDGKKCRFVYVDHGGQKGWILENYLNF